MIPSDDRGFTLGDGLFETVLAEAGVLAGPEAHLDRLAAGCAVIGLPSPDRDEALRVAVSVHPSYLEAAFGAIEQRHGSLDAYLEETLGLDAALRTRVREKVLEKVPA